jgi:drug/metabolite transporter (DMT)-like permease
MKETIQNNKAYFALILVCLIWGTTYLVNKLGVSSMPPLYFTSVRQIIAGIILLAYLFLIKKEIWPDKKYIYLQIILGVLLISGGNGVGIYGLQYIDSGISAILACFSPILMAFLSSLTKAEHKIDKWTWVGLSLGTLGVIIICIQKMGLHPGAASVKGIFFTLISVIAWSSGSVYSKLKTHSYSPFLSAGFQMLFGGIPVFITSMILEKPLGFSIGINHILIWLYTIFLGSLIAYTCFIYCLKHLPVTLVSIHNYINPVLAIILGVLILNESITLGILVGATITLSGVYIVTRQKS